MNSPNQISLEQAICQEKRNFLIETNSGISMPMAGAIYWIVLGIAGYSLPLNEWVMLAFFTSGLIFPLGILLARPMNANVLKKGPIANVTFPALIGMLGFWPIAMLTYSTNPTLTPLVLAIGMSLHWPVMGWIYGTNIGIIHLIVSAAVVTALWISMPELQLQIIPFAVSIIYLMSIAGFKWEVSRAKQYIKA